MNVSWPAITCGESGCCNRDLYLTDRLYMSCELKEASTTKLTEVITMLRYIPGLAGAIVAMVAFRLLTMFDFPVRILVFLVVYVVMTIVVEKAMARYGKKDS